MHIAQIDTVTKNDFGLLAKECGTIFSSPEWLSLWEDVQFQGIFDDNQTLIGGFYSCTSKMGPFSYLRNAPYTPHNGLFFKSRSSNKAQVSSDRKQVIQLLKNFVQEKNCKITSFNLPDTIIDVQPFIWSGFKVIPHYTYKIDLAKKIEDIHKDFLSQRRNDIKKAEKDQLTCKLESDLSIAKTLISNTFDRKGKDLNTQYIDKILFNFANSENSFAFVTYNREIPISVVFCIHDSNTAYYLLGGYNNEHKHPGAGAMAVWQAINHAKSLGLKYFDFEGSMLPEVEKFFRAFGGDMHTLYSVNRAWLPLEMLFKLKKRAQF